MPLSFSCNPTSLRMKELRLGFLRPFPPHHSLHRSLPRFPPRSPFPLSTDKRLQISESGEPLVPFPSLGQLLFPLRKSHGLSRPSRSDLFPLLPCPSFVFRFCFFSPESSKLVHDPNETYQASKPIYKALSNEWCFP